MGDGAISLRPLWAQAFVADNEDDAVKQAFKQAAPYEGHVILVDRLTGQHPDHDDWLEFDCRPEVPVRFDRIDDDLRWETVEMIPTWYVSPIAPDQTATTQVRRGGEVRQITVRLADCDWLWTEAPAIGSADGFGDHKTEFIQVADDWWPSNVERESGDTAKGQVAR